MRVLELFFGAIGYVAATTTNLKPWKSGSTNATFDKLYRAYMFSWVKCISSKQYIMMILHWMLNCQLLLNIVFVLEHNALHFYGFLFMLVGYVVLCIRCYNIRKTSF